MSTNVGQNCGHRSSLGMDILAAHLSAEDTFEDVLRRVPDGAWDKPSRCPGWTIRDVTGHVVWGRQLVAGLARGEEPRSREGAPGAEQPSMLLTDEPLTAWLMAREDVDALLTPTNMRRPGPAFLRKDYPDLTLGQFLDNLTVDLLAHSWDIGSMIGADLSVEPAALNRARRAIEKGLPRRPGWFDKAHEPAEDATPFERFLAYTGRRR